MKPARVYGRGLACGAAGEEDAMPVLKIAALAALLVVAPPALAQESTGPASIPTADSAGLSFRLVDESADPASHSQETQVTFKDQVLWLEVETPITARMVASARPYLDGPDKRPTVGFQLTPEGAERFAALTRANVGRRIAILVGGRVVSAPRIQTEMSGGQGAISGDLTRRQASLLAMQINDAAGAH
jgi:preprotein translocase subunit SecD